MSKLTDFLANLNYKTMKEGLIRFSKYWYLRLVRIKASPHNIAIGLAMGVFAGLLPILPFQTIVAVALAFPVKGSKIAAALGTWISNPLNWVPLYLLFYYIGAALAPFDVPPFDPSQIEMEQMIELGWKFFAAMMIGGLVIAIPSTIISYFLCYKLIEMYRRKRSERLAMKQPFDYK